MAEERDEKLRGLMVRYYEAYNSEDPHRLGALLDESVTLSSGEGTQVGRDAYLATYRYMIEVFVDRMTPDRIATDGDTAVVAITDVLTARDDVADFMGRSLRAGETISLKLQGRYTVAGGKIAAIEISTAG